MGKQFKLAKFKTKMYNEYKLLYQGYLYNKAWTIQGLLVKMIHSNISNQVIIFK